MDYIEKRQRNKAFYIGLVVGMLFVVVCFVPFALFTIENTCLK